MGKNSFSAQTKAKLEDLNSLKNRYDTYDRNTDNSNLSTFNKLSAKVDSAMSVVESLGSRLLMSFAPEEDINNLVNAMHQSAESSRNLLIDSKERDKNILSASKTEAALKGFVLPIAKDGNFENLEQYGLTEREINIAFDATKKSLLEVSNKDIPSKEYNKQIQEEYLKIIEKNNFSKDKIEAFENFLKQGVKSPQDKGITTQERQELMQSAKSACKEFVEIFDKNQINIKNKDLILSSNITDKLISNYTEAGKTVSSATKEKLSSIVAEVTKNLSPAYIDKNFDKITQSLTQEVDKSKTFFSNFKNDIKISSKNVDKISSKIISSFKQESLEFQTKIDAEKKLQEVLSSPKKLNQTQEKLMEKANDLGQILLTNSTKSQNTSKLTPPPSLKTPKIQSRHNNSKGNSRY